MSEQLFQIGIKAIIRNENGDILLVAIKYPGQDDFWDLPGGRMDAGENFMQALARELKEEIGVSYVGEPKLFMPMVSNFTVTAVGKEVALALIAYEVELPADAEPVPTEKDSTIEWVAPAKAAELLSTKFPPEFCELIAKL